MAAIRQQDRGTAEIPAGSATVASTSPHSTGVVRAQQFFIEKVEPLLLAARTAGTDQEWSKLSRDAFKNEPGYSGFTYNLARKDDWYGALRACGVTDAEIKSIDLGRRRIAGARAAEKLRDFSAPELEKWFKEKIDPRITAARESGDWSALTRSALKGDPMLVPAVGYFCGPGNTSWYDVLKAKGVEPSEIAQIRSKGSEQGGSKIASLRRLFSDAELQDWSSRELRPLLEAARKSQLPADWAKLASGAHEIDIRFHSFCYRFSPGGSSYDWYGALSETLQVTKEEARLISRASRSAANRSNGVSGRTSIRLMQIVAGASDSKLGSIPVHDPVAVEPISKNVITVTIDTKVLDRESSPAQLYRLMIGSRHSIKDWNKIADAYEAVYTSLATHLTNRTGYAFMLKLGLEGKLPLGVPREILSVGSGLGSIFRASGEHGELLMRAKVEPPKVTDYEGATEMLSRSPNPNQILGDAAALAVPKGKYQAIECSSLLAFGPETTAAFLNRAAEVLPQGGLLWLKTDGPALSPSFIAGLERLGFTFPVPPNTALALRPFETDRADAEKARQAQSKARYTYAVKTAPASGAVGSEEITYQRKAVPVEETAVLAETVKALTKEQHDSEILGLAAKYFETVRGLSDETLARNEQFIGATYLKLAKKIYLSAELPPFPPASDRTAEEVRAVVGLIIDRVRLDLERLGSEGHPLRALLDEMERAGTRILK